MDQRVRLDIIDAVWSGLRVRRVVDLVEEKLDCTKNANLAARHTHLGALKNARRGEVCERQWLLRDGRVNYLAPSPGRVYDGCTEVLGLRWSSTPLRSVCPA